MQFVLNRAHCFKDNVTEGLKETYACLLRSEIYTSPCFQILSSIQKYGYQKFMGKWGKKVL
jgi:hypothetical protein